MNTQAIAQHLNLAEELITEVQEWAKVLWVRIKGMRPRFVSKKVVKMTALEQIKQDWVKMVIEKINAHVSKGGQIRGTVESIAESTWKDLVKDARRQDTKTIGIIHSKYTGAAPEEVEAFAVRLIGYFAKADTRDKTTKALDSMYGRNGWDNRDREDYEG